MKKFLAMVSLSVLLIGSVAWGGEPVVAQFPDKSYTFTDLERLMSYSNVWRQTISQKSDPKIKSAIITRILRAKAAADLARSKGLDKLPDVQEALEIIVNDFLAQEYVRREIVASVTVTDEEVKDYYDKHPNNFRLAESVEAKHILIAVDKDALEGTWNKAREEAEKALKRVESGEDFSLVASEMSDDYNSSAKGGDLGRIIRGKTVPEFEEAVFSLKPGEVSGIVKTPYGFEIIKVVEKQEAKLEDFEKVQDNIKTKKLADAQKIAIEQFFIDVLQGPGIKIEPTLLGGSSGHGGGGGHSGHGGGH